MTEAQRRLDAMVVLGTRPEAIKLAPLVQALRARRGARVRVLSTGQHREMLQPMLELFGLRPDEDLDLQRPGQSLEHILVSVLEGLPGLLEARRPDVLVVQGDTSTTFAAALVAFLRGIPVAHLEAGLRTADPRIPFPEEMNRRLTSRLAELHLAPTERAAEALRREGVDERRIHVTGNTVVDALRWLREERRDLLRASWPEGIPRVEESGQRLVLVTGHRRESFGRPFERLCDGLRRVADLDEDLQVVYPVHLNPEVQRPVRSRLADHGRIRLLEPLSYPSLLALLEKASLVITDSGGIQEEAPSFGVPVLVTRDVTERMEGVEAGVSVLVGTDPDRMEAEARRALGRQRRTGVNPFGDGHAAERCVELLMERFAREGDA